MYNIFLFKEHYFDPQSGMGYLSWKIKTVQRSCSQKRSRPSQSFSGGPRAERSLQLGSLEQLSGEECKEAISFLKYCSDENAVKKKMQTTFQYRRQMIEDAEKCGEVLTQFPRFKDVKGLVSNVL